MLLIRISLLLISCFSITNMNAQDLKIHKWENRVLIIKTSSVASEKYKNQLKEFSDASAALKDRRFVIYTIVGEDFTFTNYKNSTLNSTGKLSGKLAKFLNVKEDFEIILIGLDSGTKLKQTQLLTKEKLFGLVDSMPMRSNELRRNKTKN